MGRLLVTLEKKTDRRPFEVVMHWMDACPDRLSLKAGSFDLVDAGQNEFSVLKTRYKSCQTCQQLDVATSADRVRFLLAGLAERTGTNR